MKEHLHLTLKQQRFIQNYLELGNATEAVRKAGYTSKYPDKTAQQILNSEKVKAILLKSRAAMKQESEVNAAWIIDKLKKIISNPEKEENAIKAINELNKMLGTYAPEEKINTNTNTITVKETLEELKAAREIYKKDF